MRQAAEALRPTAGANVSSWIVVAQLVGGGRTPSMCRNRLYTCNRLARQEDAPLKHVGQSEQMAALKEIVAVVDGVIKQVVVNHTAEQKAALNCAESIGGEAEAAAGLLDVDGRTKCSTMVRWQPEEDECLRQAVEASRPTTGAKVPSWIVVAQLVGGGRTPSMCRNRYGRNLSLSKWRHANRGQPQG